MRQLLLSLWYRLYASQPQLLTRDRITLYSFTIILGLLELLIIFYFFQYLEKVVLVSLPRTVLCHCACALGQLTKYASVSKFSTQKIAVRLVKQLNFSRIFSHPWKLAVKHNMALADLDQNSRFEKSLGLLTTRFVNLLQEAEDGVLDLKVVSDMRSLKCLNFPTLIIGSRHPQCQTEEEDLWHH